MRAGGGDVSIVMQLIAFALLSTGASLLLGALFEIRHALTLWRARRVSARELRGSSGIVDVRGPARAEEPLMGPLTGRSCVQFTVVMERASPKGGVKRDGDPDLITFVAAAPFTVDDGTGRVHVDLRTRRVPITGTSVIRKPLERLTQPLDKLLAVRLHKPGGLWCMNRNVTATEAALLDGTEVSVVARKTADGFLPLHVTTGRVRVVALQGLMRAGMAVSAAALFLGAWLWVR